MLSCAHIFFEKKSNIFSLMKVTLTQANSGHVASTVYSLRPSARAHGIELEVELGEQALC